MNMLFVRPAIAVTFLGLVGGCATSPADEPAAQARGQRTAAAGLCSAGETPLFQCRIGAEQVAVCGGRSASGQSYAQYRSEQPGAVTMSYPAGREGGAGNMVRASIPYSGGGEAQFHFTNQGDHTIVYSRVVRTGFGTTNNPQFSAGVAVRRGGRLVSDRACSDGDSANVDLGAAEPFVPEGAPARFDD